MESLPRCVVVPSAAEASSPARSALSFAFDRPIERAMTKAPLAAYPQLRMRRLRQADWIRRLVRETTLTPADFIWSGVVHEGDGRVPVPSMPGVERWSVTEAAKAAREAKALGIPAIAIFPYIDAEKK